MDTARYVFETRQKEDPKSAATAKAKAAYERLRAAYDESRGREQAAQKAWDGTKAALAELQKTKREAEEALAKIDEEYDRYRAKLKTLRQDDAFYFVRNAPIADMLAPSLKIQQVQLDGLSNDVNFLRSQRVDRCVTCHIAAEKRGFEDKQKYPESVLRTHPRLDLFVDSNSPHPLRDVRVHLLPRRTRPRDGFHARGPHAERLRGLREARGGAARGPGREGDARRRRRPSRADGGDADRPLDEGVRLGGRQVQRPPDVPDEGRRGGVLPLPPPGRGPPEGREARPGPQAHRVARLLELPQDEGHRGPAEARAEPRARRGEDDAGVDGPLAREPARLPQQHEDAAVLLPRELRHTVRAQAHGHDGRGRHGLPVREIRQSRVPRPRARATRRGARSSSRTSAARAATSPSPARSGASWTAGASTART